MKENKGKYSIGFVSAHYLNKGEDSNRETVDLLFQLEEIFSEVIVIDPRKLATIFDSHQGKCKILHDGRDISGIDGLIVRSSRKFKKSLEILVKALNFNGCVFLDSPERHNGEEPSKMFTSIDRIDTGVGITSCYAFSIDDANNMIDQLDFKNKKYLSKPIFGSKGRGIELARNRSELKSIAMRHFKGGPTLNEPFFVQEKIDIKDEYRVMVLGGKVVSSVIKIPEANSVTANSATGTVFNLQRNHELESFVVENLDDSGLYGVDVAVTKKGKYYIIEANRAPLWSAFEQATDVNMSKLITDYFFNKINNLKG